MKNFHTLFVRSMILALILGCMVFFAGCTSETTSITSGTAQPTVTAPITIDSTTEPITILPQTTSSRIPTTTVDLSDGVTITYPSDWRLEEPTQTSTEKDYGRSTVTIANFYSPAISSERALQAQPNVDESGYSTLIIDVDSNPGADLENYFNKATIALQTSYGSIDITKHNYQLKISPTDSFTGYRSYQMDFDTKDMRGSYIFTIAHGKGYIFSFRNPSPYSEEVMEMYKSIQIK